jgi:hypothetical protein
MHRFGFGRRACSFQMDLGGLSIAQLEGLDEIYSQGIALIHAAKVHALSHAQSSTYRTNAVSRCVCFDCCLAVLLLGACRLSRSRGCKKKRWRQSGSTAMISTRASSASGERYAALVGCPGLQVRVLPSFIIPGWQRRQAGGSLLWILEIRHLKLELLNHIQQPQ